MHDVGIVIVTHNSSGDIGPCLRAALATGAVVQVVDNASSDNTLDEIHDQGAAVIANTGNRGFAAAVNQGIRAIESEYVLLLNPDAILLGGLEALRTACAGSGVGAAGGKLVDFTGAVQAGFTVRTLPTPLALAFEVLLINRLWPRNPVNWQYRCYDFRYSEPAEVEQPAGAFLMVRRAAWRELGGFDENFWPVWFEDVDFCRRLRERGFRILYQPEAAATHRGGHSIRKILLEKREFYWYRSLLKYSFKHFRQGQCRLLCLAVIIGSLPRMAIGVIWKNSLRPIRAYTAVIRLASGYLLFGPGKTGVPPFS